MMYAPSSPWLLDRSRIKMVVDIPKNLIINLPSVEGVEVVFDAFPDRKIPATIYEVGTEASTTTRTQIRKELNVVPGVARVDFWGIQDERDYIDVAETQLSRLGLKADDLQRTLQVQN